jgi:hypothetical protein
MPAGCNNNDYTAMVECQKTIGKAPDMMDNKALCAHVQKLFSCNPKCVCDNAAAKANAENGVKATFGTLTDCTLTCAAGGAAGLRASVLTGILAAFVAIFAAK